MPPKFEERSREGAATLKAIYDYGTVTPDDLKIVQVATIEGNVDEQEFPGVFAVMRFRRHTYALNIVLDKPGSPANIHLLSLSSDLHQYDEAMRSYLKEGPQFKWHIARDVLGYARSDVTFARHHASLTAAALYRMIFMTQTNQFLNCMEQVYGEITEEDVTQLLNKCRESLKFWYEAKLD